MSPPDPGSTIRTHRLQNGLHVLLLSDPSLPLAAVHVGYEVGSKDDPRGRTGLAHLFEHMLFQGSENVGTNDHFRLIQQAGGVANGATGPDRTTYFETVPSRHLELALWLEADRMGSLLPALSEQKLDGQREVVINERRQRVDNQPYGLAFERLNELAYPPDHPYRSPVIGYPRDLGEAGLDDLRDFFRTFYSPANAVLSLVGDFDPDDAMESVERHFAPIAGAAEAPAPSVPEESASAPVRQVMPDRVELPRVYFAFPAPRFGEPEWYAGDLLGRALSGGKSSPLYQDLVYRRQIARDVSTFILPTRLSSLFLMVATARAGVSLATLEQALEEHRDRARLEAPVASEVERARARVLTGHFSRLQSFDRRADLISLHQTFFRDPQAAWKVPDRYRQVEARHLASFADGVLRPERQVTIAVIPEASGG